MMITLNCGWGLPGEEVSAEDEGIQHAIQSLNAAFGTDWKPANPTNDNLPEYLYVVL